MVIEFSCGLSVSRIKVKNYFKVLCIINVLRFIFDCYYFLDWDCVKLFILFSLF